LSLGWAVKTFSISARARVGGWLFTHAAIIVSMSCSLYATGEDPARLLRTRDAVVLGLRSARELVAAQRRIGVPVLRKNLGLMIRLPEPILVPQLSRMFLNPDFVFGMRHAYSARDEMKFLTSELQQVARKARVATPIFDKISAWLDRGTPIMPDGSG
jgi:hypothetical protein